MIRRVLRPLARRVEFCERVRLVERYELPLTRLADERLTGQGRPTEQRADSSLHTSPRLDEVGGKLLGMARTVEPRNRGARGIKRSQCLAVHELKGNRERGKGKG